MIEQRLYEHLRDNVPSVSRRVFANIMAQDTPKPALVYVADLEKVDGGIQCNDPDVTIQWVVYAYDTEYLAVKAVKNEVRAALSTFEPIPENFSAEDAFDPDTELFVQIIKFTTKE